MAKRQNDLTGKGAQCCSIRTWKWHVLGVYVIFCGLGHIVVHCFQFVQHILYRLHQDRLQRLCECIGLVQVVFFQRNRDFRSLSYGVFSWLSLQDEVGDGKPRFRRRRSCIRFLRGLVLFSNVVQNSADGVPDDVFWENPKISIARHNGNTEVGTFWLRFYEPLSDRTYQADQLLDV